MKIGILTQPLINNYGGLLQAYALQSTLKEMGHEVWIINRQPSKPTIKRIVKNQVKRIISKHLLKRTTFSLDPNTREKEIIGTYTNYFKRKHIQPITSEITDNKQLNEIKNLNFDAIVVGSDQVWRPKYSPDIFNYFLDFIEKEDRIKKISYAASFGVDQWEFTPEQTRICSELVKKFNAVSVRESSGVKLCENYLSISASHVLDPTLLLNVSKYIQVIQEENEPTSEGKLMTYILDQNTEKDKLITDVSNRLKIKPFTVMQKEKLTGRNSIEDSIFPPVSKWLKGFMDADFVITDSFHGCVFSIIFNKPFLAVGNKNRGIARFTSILKTFNLEDRLIVDNFSFDEKMIDANINWENVNKILEKEQQKSFSFLENALK